MTTVVLWFPESGTLDGVDYVFSWQQSTGEQSADGHRSLPGMVAANGDLWKGRYLDWLAQLAESPTKGASLNLLLTLEDGVNYWWFTLPTEPSYTASSLPYSIIRLWAFAEAAQELGANRVIAVGAPDEVLEALLMWGARLGIAVEHREPKDAGQTVDPARLRGTSKLAPARSRLRAAAYLAREVVRYARSMKTTLPASDHDGLTVIDYFDNFVVDTTGPAPYASQYWGQLPVKLASLGVPVTWVHIDFRSPSAPTLRNARNAITFLNNAEGNGLHVLLQDLLSLTDLPAAIRYYTSIGRAGRLAARADTSWDPGNTGIDVFPLVRSRWLEYFTGVEAMRNALWLVLFSKLVTHTDASTTGLYLMENQPWEMALLHAWRDGARGALAGVVHSTVRFWDLRYAMGGRSASVVEGAEVPRPDVILVNGPKASDMLTANGVPAGILRHVEALRYEVDSAGSSASGTPDSVAGRRRVLIMGEYDRAMAIRQIEMANELVTDLGTRLTVIFRPHPSTDATQLPVHSDIAISSQASAVDDIAKCDVVVCSTVSSATVDAMIAGKSIVVIVDPRYLDGRILPADRSVREVASAAELIEAISSEFPLASGRPAEKPDIFFQGKELSRWQSALTELLGTD